MNAKTMSLIIDGVLDTSATLTEHADGPLGDDDGAADPFTTGAQRIDLTSEPGSFFLGALDEVTYYNRALSPCEVRAVFIAGSLGKCKGDSDGDGVMDIADNCPLANNSTQADSDFDGVGDPCDCAPADTGVFGLPAEVCHLDVGADGTNSSLAWSSSITGTSTVYDALRGALNEFPVGTGSSEACLPPGGFPNPFTTDTDTPGIGTGFWYLARARNACGVGTYGYQSNGTERISIACP